MKLCILTIIKNELEYLEEWIKYHLNLGIDHLFIFQDIGSKSHKEITDKYEKVSLIQIKKKYVLSKYIVDGLSYIKNNYDYDWCFAIDIDEYITVNDNIKSIMLLFKDYDALVLLWENYGANGYIHKPNYESIIETYTKKGELSSKDGERRSVKTAYKLSTFTPNSLLSNHNPSDKIKWCKPNFKNDKKEIVYDKIYLRHYMTKSFEEYVLKVYIRGMFSKKYRNFDDFFLVNPDMLDKKEELLKLANEIICLNQSL